MTARAVVAGGTPLREASTVDGRLSAKDVEGVRRARGETRRRLRAPADHLGRQGRP